MKIERDGDLVRFYFRWGNQRVRRVVALVDLVKFLEGERLRESNLPEGRLAVNFSEFAAEKYLPRCAKPNLKFSSYEREFDSAKALGQHFGEELLHKIDLEAWEVYKTGRLNGTLAFSKRKCANSTVDKEFDCLKRILNYGTQLGLLKRNPLLGVKGLKNESRKSIWLAKGDIERLLESCEPWLRDLMEFRVLTGARPSEAAVVGERNVDRAKDEIWVCTLKKRTPGEHRRYFSIPTLGSRFRKLLGRLKPHPKTGLYFYRPDGTPYQLITVEHAFGRARTLANLPHITSYDLRGTFAMHRAMVVKGFRQLQSEMGHSNPNSIQSYLDEAARCSPEESIFYEDAKNANKEAPISNDAAHFPHKP
jgi:integrase